MALDLTKDINNVTRQINGYLRDDLPVPHQTLDHYNTLVSSVRNTQTLESGTTTFPTGSLSSSFPSVGTTSSEVLSSASNRTYILIQNTGDETAFLNFNNAAGVGAGLKLLPGAEFSTQVPQFTEASIEAIAEANTTTLAIYEVG